MKNIICISAIFSFLLFGPLPVFAAPSDTVREAINEKVADLQATVAQRKEEHTEKMDTNLKERAQKEITRRTDSLEKLITKISSIKKLSDAQKQSLTTQVQTEITELKALLDKINGDTDATTLKTDVQSIIKSYRVYALLIPEIRIIVSADRMLTVADQLSTLADKLETRLEAAEAKGQDVSALLPLVTDMRAKIADAKTKAQSAIDKVTVLTPVGFPGNRKDLQDARQLVVAAQKDLLQARFDAQKIFVDGLKKSASASATPTSEASPSATTTP